jgi:hypothetical protein
VQMKAIETSYRGYRFRSRSEARWAVFFDKAGVEWDYECQGYETTAGRYLPDFYLPGLSEWIEIKPRIELITPKERAKTSAFSAGGASISVLTGKPWPAEYRFFDPVSFEKTRQFWMKCPNCNQVVFAEIEGSKGSNHPGEHRFWCPVCEIADPVSNGFGYCRASHDLESCEVRLAFAAARSARFEHGEKP